MAFFDTQAPLKNLVTPFSGKIQRGLREGFQITIQGNTHSMATKFMVNFQIGHSGDDIAFHFNPQFEDGGYVVCNMKENGYWGPEEREMEMPFKKVRPFELCFVVQNLDFKVMVNKSFFTQYSHHVPYHLVDTIAVTGPMELSLITFQNFFAAPVQPVFSTMQFSQPLQFPQQPMGHKPKSRDLRPVHQALVAPGIQPVVYPNAAYPVPFFATIQYGFKPKKSIIISGTVLPNAKSFHINLCHGTDIDFHLNPCFDENANHCFKVVVDGHHLCDYWHHLTDLQVIAGLEVAGDVQLTHVHT
ncbi:galectin-9 isoform X1 [Sigmodon hispidus]